jgi:hypothetical protein
MSKVMIVNLLPKNYKQKPIVMTWEEYLEFCKVTKGEGVTWKAVLT